MVSFLSIDIIIIAVFFILLVSIGFIAGRNSTAASEDYLLSGRKVGLGLFILTNVATWYGGILGVGEFTYRYGLVSWFTQGFPYYIFAILFAVFFARKIRTASLFTIPDKIEKIYGKKVSALTAGLIFILVSPAPYLFMIGSLISLVFEIDLLPSLIIGVIVSTVYLFRGGYKSNIYADAFSFFVMFAGFILALVVAWSNFGGLEYLATNVPQSHLSLTGNVSPAFIIVWFLIALWTFTDPGFHQRCYSAGTGKIAFWGIIISVFFWFGFDFLTTSLGLYARATLGEIDNPVLAFPLLAEAVLSPGLKGIFYAALFATIISTLNSFMFLSATTYGRDFAQKLTKDVNESTLNRHTRIGLIISALISIIAAYFFESVVEIWYTIGSICIPGIIILIISAYYPKLRVTNSAAMTEVISATAASVLWLIARSSLSESHALYVVEPMIAGMLTALIIHIFGMKYMKRSTDVKE
jgi:SSS family solute:Na+ symporter